MDIQRINNYKSAFDSVAHEITNDDGEVIEVWYARELQELLGYSKWDNFSTAINRAIDSCKTQGIAPTDHFLEVGKMVTLGSGSQREIRDIILTRYACYLIAQNGDPRKEEIAFAQSYFAVQTRKAELIEERLQLFARLETRERLRISEKQLSQNIYERGVDDKGFARIRSKGDSALFGGVTTDGMKKRLGVKSGALADHLPTLTIAAKNLATEMTNYNVEQKDMQGERPITAEHISNNKSVREMLGKRGIKPEELPPAEDIKKVERRVAREEKVMIKNIAKFPQKLNNINTIIDDFFMLFDSKFKLSISNLDLNSNKIDDIINSLTETIFNLSRVKNITNEEECVILLPELRSRLSIIDSSIIAEINFAAYKTEFIQLFTAIDQNEIAKSYFYAKLKESIVKSLLPF